MRRFRSPRRPFEDGTTSRLEVRVALAIVLVLLVVLFLIGLLDAIAG